MAKNKEKIAHGVGINDEPEETMEFNTGEGEQTQEDVVRNQIYREEVIANATIARAELMSKFLNPGKDINTECGYPPSITKQNYRDLYDRMGLASRIVNIFPEESWSLLPEINENEDEKESEFEKQWKEMQAEKNIYQVLKRVDVLSGIGRYGLLLIGIDDGKALNEAVDGINPVTGETTEGEGTKERKLLYLKPFDESVVNIVKREGDAKSPRYGLPVKYSIQFENVKDGTTGGESKEVHWTRVLHVTDNRISSDIVGEPRMKKVYNRLLDIRKVLGGSGEMFWKGGFPGLAITVDPTATISTTQQDDIKTELSNYSKSLQRYLSLVGVDVKTLDSQVADPRGHLECQIDFICAALGIPKRIFVGSERGELASSQDAKAWNKRIGHRQEFYLTPLLIREFIDRLIALHVLPVVEYYVVKWPDLNAPSDSEIAEVAGKQTEAMSKYVAGSVDHLIPPREFLTLVMKYSDEQVDAIEKASDSYSGDAIDEKEAEMALREAEAFKAEQEAAKKLKNL